MAVDRINRGEIFTDARSRFSEPTDGRRFLNTELDQWLKHVLDEITLLNYEKKELTITGASYLTAYGATPYYYSVPDDYFMLDPDYGVTVNGVRYDGITRAQVDMYQEQALPGTTMPYDVTLYVDDFFRDRFSGRIMEFGVDFIKKADIGATPGYGSGYLMWFLPNLAATDVIKFPYICFPTYPATDADTTLVTRTFQELLVLGECIRMAQKEITSGLSGTDLLLMYQSLFDKKYDEAKKYFKKKTPDRQMFIRNPLQVQDRYCSARRTMATSSETDE